MRRLVLYVTRGLPFGRGKVVIGMICVMFNVKEARLVTMCNIAFVELLNKEIMKCVVFKVKIWMLVLVNGTAINPRPKSVMFGRIGVLCTKILLSNASNPSLME